MYLGMSNSKTRSTLTRRGFLSRSTLAAMSVALGAEIVFAKHLPSGMMPIALVDQSFETKLPGKSPELIILNNRPINAETPAHFLDPKLTRNDLFFVRNNGIPPAENNINPDTWTLTIDGESAQQKRTFTLAELKRNFKNYTYNLTLECGGNGRKEFNPPAKGNQWNVGAVGCAAWTGVRLKEVLEAVGIKKDAVYVAYYGSDSHLTGDPNKNPISRGVPIRKALENESLIAWAMNGEPLPYLNGYPLRLIFGGYPASCSGKWLNRIQVRDRVHDGEKMGGQSYRVPCETVAPGAKVADEAMCIIEEMPVKSLLTFPKTGAMLQLGQRLPIRGHAWSGYAAIQKVDYSIDFGATWQQCLLKPPTNRYAWQHFEASIAFPQKGYYEIWAKATDEAGKAQPMVLPGWNPKGYLNNACHRIAVKVR